MNTRVGKKYNWDNVVKLRKHSVSRAVVANELIYFSHLRAFSGFRCQEWWCIYVVSWEIYCFLKQYHCYILYWFLRWQNLLIIALLPTITKYIVPQPWCIYKKYTFHTGEVCSVFWYNLHIILLLISVLNQLLLLIIISY